MDKTVQSHTTPVVYLPAMHNIIIFSHILFVYEERNRITTIKYEYIVLILLNTEQRVGVCDYRK